MDSAILHSDLNNFYASVECLHRPSLRGVPVAVGGDPLLRHGIVLAKNNLAKAAGVRTGEALWQARQKCPGLVTLPPNYPLYLRVARKARAIYADYTDRVEPFGLDEAWLDVSGPAVTPDRAKDLADTIRGRIREEIGVTASIGVSYNKIFAKLGSDMRKPDATTAVRRDNYRDTVWRLPVEDLLYVGPATTRKLRRIGILTIGDLARLDSGYLRTMLGKCGDVLHVFANGEDTTPVSRPDETDVVKSVGNSTTTPRDLLDEDDVRMVVYVLSESVAARMREQGFLCRTVQICVRDNELASFERQCRLRRPTRLASELAGAAMDLFRANYGWERPIRSIGVRGSDLCTADLGIQLSLLEDERRRLRLERLEYTVDDLRRRFGHDSVQRAMLLRDRPLGGLNPKEDNIIHPVGYF
ncbi:MAG: DNA polymerase IV [Clostridia bacterium]|nr:DNA polymerase IV [Clostridia bacterium]